MKKILSLFILLFLLTACSSSKYETITTDRALELIENGAILIDVRTSDEFAQTHIPNAVNIPLDQIENITYDKNATLVVYCATGIRSANASEKLYEMGYTSLYNLDGGLLNWGGSLEEEE